MPRPHAATAPLLLLQQPEYRHCAPRSRVPTQRSSKGERSLGRGPARILLLPRLPCLPTLPATLRLRSAERENWEVWWRSIIAYTPASYPETAFCSLRANRRPRVPAVCMRIGSRRLSSSPPYSPPFNPHDLPHRLTPLASSRFPSRNLPPFFFRT